jgi:molybdopterin molybdotransferase
MGRVVSVEEALRIVEGASGAPRRRVETVALADALGRVLAEDVLADRDMPPFTRATMDGFALRAADLASAPRSLRVVGRVTAGEVAGVPVGAGEAIAIMTGAPLPDGADAVVPVERVQREADGSAVRVPGPLRTGENVSRRGEQVARGDVVLRTDARLGPGEIGVLAASGRATVAVARRPRVAILCTGDELVSASEDPGAHGIRDSNGHALRAQVERAGGVGDYRGPLRDDPAALVSAIEAGLEADVLCLSGGVSAGEKDYVPGALEAAGVERLFHKWAVKPGGPLWMGRRGDVLVFALPGNPVATFVGFEMLVVPALRTRLGLPFRPRRTVRALFDGTTGRAIPRRQLLPVALGQEGSRAVARPVRMTGSGDPYALAGADALAVVPEGARIERPRETEVDVVPLGAGA